MNKTTITTLLLLTILSLTVATAWPWSITGNVLAPNQKMALTAPEQCYDSNEGAGTDGGYVIKFGLVNSWKPDKAEGATKSITILDEKGNIKTVTGKEKLTVYACDDKNLVSTTFTATDLGPGVAVTERQTIKQGKKTKTLNVARWVTQENFCQETEKGILTQDGRTQKKGECNGNTYIQRYCEGNLLIERTPVLCTDECTPNGCSFKGYCYGDSDAADDKTIVGTLYLKTTAKDGTEKVEEKHDYCTVPEKTGEESRLVQLSCGENAQLKKTEPQSCPGNSRCVEGRCFSASVTTNDLTERIALLEDIICQKISSTYSFCNKAETTPVTEPTAILGGTTEESTSENTDETTSTTTAETTTGHKSASTGSSTSTSTGSGSSSTQQELIATCMSSCLEDKSQSWCENYCY